MAVSVETFGTAKISEEKLTEAILKVFDLRPAAIIEALDLRKPIYEKTSAYGHFNSPNFSWEQTNMVQELQEKL